MTKSYPIKKFRIEWAKHLKPHGKRRANKNTRSHFKLELKSL